MCYYFTPMTNIANNMNIANNPRKSVAITFGAQLIRGLFYVPVESVNAKSNIYTKQCLVKT